MQSIVLSDEPLVCWLHVGNRLQFSSLQAFQTLKLLSQVEFVNVQKSEIEVLYSADLLLEIW